MMIASCKFCNNQGKKFTSTTRLVEHLNSCLLIPANLKKALKVYTLKQEGKRVAKGEASRIIQEGVEQMAAARHEEKKQRLMEQKTLLGSMKCAADEVADEAIARWFYANGISFNAASMEADSLYRDSGRIMITAIKRSSDGYTPPGRKILGGRLIETIHQSITKQIELNDDASQNKTRFGMTYLSDGWESCDSLPLINSAYVTANNGGVYIRSVDTSGAIKTAEYCASLMIEDIYAAYAKELFVQWSNQRATTAEQIERGIRGKPEVQQLEYLRLQIEMRVLGLGQTEYATRWSSSSDISIGTVAHLRDLLVKVILPEERHKERKNELPQEASPPLSVPNALRKLGTTDLDAIEIEKRSLFSKDELEKKVHIAMARRDTIYQTSMGLRQHMLAA
ncbi:hypothetical protein AB1Y20_001254 [Prymnesium parvum]|uniref:Uncharacterized protein n=1 Tax=Prymnesium parvum TaxID=97485 RepID=A0AB34K862_PRYPA